MQIVQLGAVATSLYTMAPKPKDAACMSKFSQKSLSPCMFNTMRDLGHSVKKELNANEEPAAATTTSHATEPKTSSDAAAPTTIPTTPVPSSAASSGDKPKGIAADKGFYNKFKYRMGVCGEEAVQHYKELQATGDEVALQSFMRELVATKGAVIDEIVGGNPLSTRMLRISKKVG